MMQSPLQNQIQSGCLEEKPSAQGEKVRSFALRRKLLD